MAMGGLLLGLGSHDNCEQLQIWYIRGGKRELGGLLIGLVSHDGCERLMIHIRSMVIWVRTVFMTYSFLKLTLSHTSLRVWEPMGTRLGLGVLGSSSR